MIRTFTKFVGIRGCRLRQSIPFKSTFPPAALGLKVQKYTTTTTTARTGLTREQIEVTNIRYQDDPFWSGPKGLEYGLLLGAQPYQVANLYPDAGTSYFVSWLTLPKDGRLIFKGEYGHQRYFSFTSAVILPGGQLGNGDCLVDEDIQPDPGSVNPFQPDSNRYATPRNYTLALVNGIAPPPGTERPANTVYTGGEGVDVPVHLALRNYIPDVGYDGTGNAALGVRHAYGLPTVNLEMGGRVFSGQKMLDLLRVEKIGQTPGSSAEDWVQLAKTSWDPENAPALPSKVAPLFFQRFWNTEYSALGGFILDPEERVRTYNADPVGGLANNPDTVYMACAVSLAHGRVFVIRGKMPSHPKTRHGEQNWEQDAQVRYWSATSGGALPSGLGWATVYDEEMPLDGDGNFTIVMSWQEDRPTNARPECGVQWLDFGNGEGHYIGARIWVNLVYIRYQHISATWEESPANIPQPTESDPLPQDARVMKEYYPKGEYMSKADFEQLTCT